MTRQCLDQLSGDSIREALRDVIDPEVGINIVDLGLIYDVKIDDSQLDIVMTMTSPACPMGPYIQDEVEARLQELVGYEVPIGIDVVWEPAWSPARMSDRARLQLGVF